MKLPPAAVIPEGGTAAERLDTAFRKVLTVPKEAVLKAEHRERIERETTRVAQGGNTHVKH